MGCAHVTHLISCGLVWFSSDDPSIRAAVVADVVLQGKENKVPYFIFLAL